MPVHRIEIGAEAQSAVREQYDAGVSLDVIARSLGLSRQTLKRRIEDLGWPARHNVRAAPEPLPDQISESVPPGAVTSIAARVQEAIERELAGVESILAALGPVELGQAERGARTLATLARTLRELMRLRQTGQSPRGGADDEPEIRDLDEFRRDLARRLDRLVADAKVACPEPAER